MGGSWSRFFFLLFSKTRESASTALRACTSPCICIRLAPSFTNARAVRGNRRLGNSHLCTEDDLLIPGLNVLDYEYKYTMYKYGGQSRGPAEWLAAMSAEVGSSNLTWKIGITQQQKKKRGLCHVAATPSSNLAQRARDPRGIREGFERKAGTPPPGSQRQQRKAPRRMAANQSSHHRRMSASAARCSLHARAPRDQGRRLRKNQDSSPFSAASLSIHLAAAGNAAANRGMQPGNRETLLPVPCRTRCLSGR